MPEKDCTKAAQRKRRVRAWAKFVWISIASGSIPAVLEAIFGHPTWRTSLNQMFGGVIFASCICGLCSLVLPRVAGRILRLRFALKWITLVSVISGLAAVGCLMANVILLLVGLVAPHEFWSDFGQSFKLALLITLVFGLSAFFHEVVMARLNKATAEIKAREEAEEKLRQVATEARLSSLESRVQPHFLFNTLNSILALIREDPAAAERMVERLAALLRFSLDANQSRLVPLSLEAKIVRDYLEIEQARFGGRLRYSIDIASEFDHVQIPPMSLQTLVENSVKYAVSTRREGAAILVRAQAGSAGLLVEVIDDGPGITAARLVPGHGLELLQNRIDGLFGSTASMEISSVAAGGTRVALQLPMAAPNAALREPELMGARL